MTPGGQRATGLAQKVAGGPGQQVGTQHLLLGLLDASDSVAAAVLGALGVTREAVEAKIAEVGTAGTSDAPPAAHVKVGDQFEVSIDDPEVLRLLAHADAGAVGDVVRKALLDHLGGQA
jgi:hypothetical protein